MGGVEFELNPKVKFTPTVLASYNRNAPVDLDLNAGFTFMNLLYAGLSYRLEDSFDLLLMYQVNRQFRIGAAYDFTSSGLRDKTPGSFEFMASYIFDYDDEKIRNLRFF
jgi:type IX secretion system PorP/SprF family membrane protein